MQRLAGDLTSEERSDLGKALVGHVAGVTTEAGALPLVVTGDMEVADWAARSALAVLPDSGTGLDDACDQGVQWAEYSGSRWLVIHSDLPLLRVSEVEALLSRIGQGGDVIAPSADGGTSAISAAGPIVFGFGQGSFRRHLPRLSDARIVARRGLLSRRRLSSRPAVGSLTPRWALAEKPPLSPMPLRSMLWRPARCRGSRGHPSHRPRERTRSKMVSTVDSSSFCSLMKL